MLTAIRFEIVAGDALPTLRLYLRAENASFTYQGGSKREIYYQKDADRGYESRGLLWSPGFFELDVSARQPAVLVGSTESWNTIQALSPDEALNFYHERRARLISISNRKAHDSPAADLVLAADQFISIRPAACRMQLGLAPAGDEIRTVIAGYHWFTDWGRDTMISLEGLDPHDRPAR